MGACCSKNRDPGTAFKKDVKMPLLDDLPEDTPVVIISVHRGRGPWENESPMVELTLKPGDDRVGEQTQKTSHKPKTGKPAWEPAEKFTFVCSNINKHRIIFSLMSGSEALGVAFLSAKDATLESQSKTLKLSNPETGKQGAGELDIDFYRTTLADRLNREQHTCYEFQRWNIVNKWGSDYPGHLLPTDPGRYCRSDGKKFFQVFEKAAPSIPEGWEVVMNWRVVSTSDDPEGWQYGIDFNSVDWFNTPDAPGSGIVQKYVRRRLWARDVKKIS